MLTRRQVFAWLGGAVAAAATLPAAAKQLIAAKPPANPYYLTNYDRPEWFDAYQSTYADIHNTSPDIKIKGTLQRGDLQVVGEMQPGTDSIPQFYRSPNVVNTFDNPALDRAIEQAMKGLA